MDLNRTRILVDFNELIEENLILLSREDSKLDSMGKLIIFYEEMSIGIYSDDNLDDNGEVDNIIADGIAVRNKTEYYPYVKWCCLINEEGICYQNTEILYEKMNDLVDGFEECDYNQRLQILDEAHALLTKLKNEGWDEKSVYNRLLPLHNKLDGAKQDFLGDILDFVVGYCNPEKYVWRIK